MSAARTQTLNGHHSRRRVADSGRSRAAQRSAPMPWDRIARWALLAISILVLILAIGPALSLLETVRESGQRTEQLRELTKRNQQLKARRDALNDPATLEREARRLGKIRPGERPYVIDGLSKK